MAFEDFNFLRWFLSKKNMIFEFQFFYFSYSVGLHDEKYFQKTISIFILKGAER